jgi:hypothetical protein
LTSLESRFTVDSFDSFINRIVSHSSLESQKGKETGKPTQDKQRKAMQQTLVHITQSTPFNSTRVVNSGRKKMMMKKGVGENRESLTTITTALESQ